MIHPFLSKKKEIPRAVRPGNSFFDLGDTWEMDVRLVRDVGDDVRRLVSELDAELSALYRAEQRHGLKLDQLVAPNMKFFVAVLEGEAVGCGGVALFEDFAEVKRMYVNPVARGKGVAHRLMEAIEEEARKGDRKWLRLETGDQLFAAMRFYKKHGFTECEAFEPYSSMKIEQIGSSRFFEKRLQD